MNSYITLLSVNLNIYTHTCAFKYLNLLDRGCIKQGIAIQK